MKIVTRLLTPNEYSRPRTKLKGVKAIVLHWVANPGTSAEGNWNYFEKHPDKSYGSAHFIIDSTGLILWAIPLNEMAYHVGADVYTDWSRQHLGGYPNNCTIGIELCHLDWEGTMTDGCIEAAHQLCMLLCTAFKLDPMESIIRHYDVTGKECPKWYVDHHDELEKFRYEVALRMGG